MTDAETGIVVYILSRIRQERGIRDRRRKSVDNTVLALCKKLRSSEGEDQSRGLAGRGRLLFLPDQVVPLSRMSRHMIALHHLQLARNIRCYGDN